MAKDYEITTKFTVDISDLKRGISDAEQQIKLANATFKNATAGMDDWENSVDGVTAKLDQLRSILDAQKKKVEAYTEEIRRNEEAAKKNGSRADELRAQLQDLADKGVSKTSDEYKSLERQLESATAEQQKDQTAADKLRVTLLNQQAAVKTTESEIGKYGSQLVELKSETGKADEKTEDLAEDVKEAGSAAEDSSDGFTVMKGALASLVAEGIRTAINALKEFAKEAIEAGKAFDSSMSQVKSISGATEDEFDALREKAKELGGTTAFTASEVADGFTYMAMAGWKTEDMLSGIDGILNLAAASGSDLATTSDIVTDALTAFGLEAKDAGRLADVMAAASANANTNVEMMGSTFQYVAPVAGALGFSIEDTAEVIGLMANAGIKGTKAGTALRSMFSRLAAPTDEAGTAMDMLGVSLTDSEGNVKDLSVVLGELREGFAGLTEAEQAQYAKAIAGQEAMSGLLAIVNASDADIEKLSGAINDASGSAEEMATVMLDNLGGDITILQSNIEGLQIELSDFLMPTMRGAVGIASKFIDALRGGASLDDVIGEIGKLYYSIRDQILPVTENATKFVLEIADKIIEALPILVDAGMQIIEGLLRGIIAETPTLLTTITKVVLDIGEMLIDNLPMLLDCAIQLLMAIVQAIPTIVQILAKKIPDIIEAISDFLIEGIPMIVDGAIALLMAIIDAIPVIIQALIPAIPRIVTAIVNGIVGAQSALLDGAVKLLMAIIQAIPILIEALVPQIPTIIETIVNTLIDNFPVLLEGAISLFFALVEAIPVIALELSKSGKKIVEAVFGGIDELPQKLKDFFVGAWSRIKEVFAGVPDFFKEKFNSAISKIKDIGKEFKQIFTDVWSGIKQTFSNIGSWFSEKFSGVISVIKAPFNVLIRAVNSVIDALNAISFDVPDWVPVIGGQKFGFDIKKLNELERGGVLRRGQMGFLEGKGAEAVVPLERNKAWIREVAKSMKEELHGAFSGGTVGGNTNTENGYNFTQIINAPKSPSRIELYRQTRNLLALASEA